MVASCLKIKVVFIVLMLVWNVALARESISVVRGPESFVSIGGMAELRDDVYSADLNVSGEYAPCNCFSVYGDFSYRFVSYEFDTMLHDQIHELVNLRVNGFNESYVGMKFMPYSFLGVDVSWRLPPGEGSQVNRFHRLGVAPMGVFRFSKRLVLGGAVEYFTFLEKQSLQPGDELGLKYSLSWKFAWDFDEPSGWMLDYVFLYRWRLQESENLGMDKPYQKMDDLYRGLKMRVDVGRYWAISRMPLGVSLFYELNRGELFGFETGHVVGLNTKLLF